ncbi:hypothetical protein PR048_008173 [Dryococelus australis]|uniref:Uncharacterized protein n=1 Tax=Dryococelus australis TaxID=614101 RepID=A0ABQ9HX45_9NEOP|nr:hypothetical protein PR048_008173 [Dryococelus australis]
MRGVEGKGGAGSFGAKCFSAIFSRSSMLMGDRHATQPTRVNRGENGVAPECKGEGNRRSSTIRHDAHLRKSGVTRPGIEPSSPWWEASSLTTQPPWPHEYSNIFPSSNCEALRKLKTYLRATVSLKRLNHVAVCYVHNSEAVSSLNPSRPSGGGLFNNPSLAANLWLKGRAIDRMEDEMREGYARDGLHSSPRELWADDLLPTKVIRARFPAGPPLDPRIWESRRTMPLGFLGDLAHSRPSTPAPLHTHLTSPSSVLKTSKNVINARTKHVFCSNVPPVSKGIGNHRGKRAPHLEALIETQTKQDGGREPVRSRGRARLPSALPSG